MITKSLKPDRIRIFAAAAIYSFVLCASTNAQTPTAMGPTATEIARSGERSGSVYRNRLLRFSIPVPEKWTFASEEMNKSMLAEGNKKIKENESETKQKQFDNSLANTAILFTVSKHRVSEPGNLAFLTTGFEDTPDSVSQLAYADYNKHLVVTKTAGGRLVKDISTVRIAGKDVLVFDAEGMPNGVKISQRYYVLAHRGGMLFFIITWLDGGDEERKTLEKMVDSARFDS